jgi:hypothetical protein
MATNNNHTSSILENYSSYTIKVYEDHRIAFWQAKQRLQTAKRQVLTLLQTIAAKPHSMDVREALQDHHQYAHQVYEDQQVVYLQSKHRLAQAERDKQGLEQFIEYGILPKIIKSKQSRPDIANIPKITATTPCSETIKTSASTPTMITLKRNYTSRSKGRRNNCQQHNSHNQTPKNCPKKSLKVNPCDESMESRRSSNHYPIAMIESYSEGEDNDDSMLVLVNDDDRQHILDSPVMEQEGAEQSKQSAKRRKLLNPSNPRQCLPKNYPREELFDRVIKGSLMKVHSRRKTAIYGSFCELNDDDDYDDYEDIHTNVPEQEDYFSNDNSNESEGAQITFFSHYSERGVTEASKQDTKKRRRQKQIIPKILKRKLRQQQQQAMEEAVENSVAQGDMGNVLLKKGKTMIEQNKEARHVKEIMGIELKKSSGTKSSRMPRYTYETFE